MSKLLFYSPSIIKEMQKSKLLIKVWFGLVSLFNGISTLFGYLMPKPFS